MAHYPGLLTGSMWTADQDPFSELNIEANGNLPDFGYIQLLACIPRGWREMMGQAKQELAPPVAQLQINTFWAKLQYAAGEQHQLDK